MQQQVSSSSLFSLGIRRLGVSVLCFGVTFFCATVMMHFLLTLDRFPVHIGDRFVTLRDLTTEERSLEQRERDAIASEKEFSLAERAPRLAMVRSLRSSSSAFGDVFPALESVQQSMASLSKRSVRFQGMFFDDATHALRLRFTIDAGSAREQSALIASFVDALRLALPAYSLLEPNYPSRDDHTDFSFVISIQLPHA